MQHRASPPGVPGLEPVKMKLIRLPELAAVLAEISDDVVWLSDGAVAAQDLAPQKTNG